MTEHRRQLQAILDLLAAVVENEEARKAMQRDGTSLGWLNKACTHLYIHRHGSMTERSFAQESGS